MRRARSRRDMDAMGTPSSDTVPLVGASVPLSSRTSVVFPEPFGPMSPTIVPRRIERETSSSARVLRAYEKERRLVVSKAVMARSNRRLSRREQDEFPVTSCPDSRASRRVPRPAYSGETVWAFHPLPLGLRG